MPSQSTERSASAPYGVAAAPLVKLLTAKEAAQILRVSESFLAKARMRGDGAALHKGRPLHSIQPGSAAAVDESSPAIVDQRAVKRR